MEVTANESSASVGAKEICKQVETTVKHLDMEQKWVLWTADRSQVQTTASCQ